MAATTRNLDYGIDSPALVRNWYHRAGWSLAGGLAVWAINRQEYPTTAAELLAVLAALALIFTAVWKYKVCSSRERKAHLREQLLDQLALRADDSVLDVVCVR